LQDAQSDFDAGVAELFNAATADERVGVCGGNDAARDSGGDQGIGAGSGASMVAAGFERNVGSGALSGDAALCGIFEGYDLGVVVAIVEMGAFGEGLPVADEHAADLGIWAGEGDGGSSEVEGLLHEGFVL